MRFAATVASFLVVLAVLAAEKDEMVANPAYKNWSEFKVGTSVTLKESVVDHSGDDPNAIDATATPPGPNESLYTLKLIQKTPEKVVVEKVLTELQGGNLVEHAPVKITYPTKIAKRYVGLPKSKVEDFKEGEEALTVDGKKIDCHWVASRIKIGEEESISKVWANSDEVPGGKVKEVSMKKQGGKVFFELTVNLVSIKKP